MGGFVVTLQGMSIREKTTISRPGYADRVETRDVAFAMTSQTPGQTAPSVVVPFSAA